MVKTEIDFRLKTTAEERLIVELLCEEILAREENHQFPDFVTVTLHASRVILLLHEYDALLADNAQLKAQLPDEMKHCTIVFKKCEFGHGRLTATNWIDHGCPTCHSNSLVTEVERLKAELAEAEQRIEDLQVMLHSQDETASARSSELRFLSTFSPVLDKRVQTEEQLFGWMAACEAWRAAIVARRTP